MRALQTPRLQLEPQSALHAEAMFAVLSDPAIYEYENAPPISQEWLRERFTKLESRRSADGSEQWLNWVLRQHGGALIGYVQATLRADGQAFIAYELASAHWGRGLGSEAVAAMIDELVVQYGVHTLLAIFKRANHRSRRLLERLGFGVADAASRQGAELEADEDLMQRRIAATQGTRR
jgi:[ribosomal protein S5]-alanine N-acetyltransferase